MMLQELHQCHMEMSKIKSLARMYVWWPGLDKDIEDSVCACRSVKPISHSHPQTIAPMAYMLFVDLLRPKTAKRVDLKQFEQKANHDVSARVRYFKMGDG